jgi:hypothetical protein
VAAITVIRNDEEIKIKGTLPFKRKKGLGSNGTYLRPHKFRRVGTLFVPTCLGSELAWAKYCLPTLRYCSRFENDPQLTLP